MLVYVRLFLLIFLIKGFACTDCQNDLNSSECLHHEIEKLRMDLRPITSELPSNVQHYLPFGSLESDWNRLLQLEALLPEGHHLRQQLTKSFLLLVQAVRHALAHQQNQNTTVVEDEIDTDLENQSNLPSNEDILGLGSNSDINKEIEKNNDDGEEGLSKSDKDLNNYDENLRTTHKASSEDTSSEEHKYPVQEVDTIVDNSNENSESVADITSARAESLVGHINTKNKSGESENESRMEINGIEDFNQEKGKDQEKMKNKNHDKTSETTDSDEVSENTKTSTPVTFASSNSLSIATTTEDLSDLAKSINFPSINQEDVLENTEISIDTITESSKETTTETQIINSTFADAEEETVGVTTTFMPSTLPEDDEEDLVEQAEKLGIFLTTDKIKESFTKNDDEVDSSIDEELREIIFPGIEESSDIPSTVFLDTTTKLPEESQTSPANELQSEEHYPLTLKNVDVFGNHNSNILSNIPNKVARHTTSKYHSKNEHNTESTNAFLDDTTETLFDKMENQNELNSITTKSINDVENINYTEAPKNHYNDEPTLTPFNKEYYNNQDDINEFPEGELDSNQSTISELSVDIKATTIPSEIEIDPEIKKKPSKWNLPKPNNLLKFDKSVKDFDKSLNSNEFKYKNKHENSRASYEIKTLKTKSYSESKHDENDSALEEFVENHENEEDNNESQYFNYLLNDQTVNQTKSNDSLDENLDKIETVYDEAQSYENNEANDDTINENQEYEQEFQTIEEKEDNEHESKDDYPEKNESNSFPEDNESEDDFPNDESLPALPILPGIPLQNKPKITIDTLDALNRIIFGKAYDPIKDNKLKLPHLSNIKKPPTLINPLDHQRYIPLPKLDLKHLQSGSPLVLPSPPVLLPHKLHPHSRASRFAPQIVSSARAQEDDLYRWFFSKFRSEDAKTVADRVKKGEKLPAFEYKGSGVSYKVGDKHDKENH